MGPGLFRDEPGSDREPVDQGGGGFRIDPADRPFATSEPDRAPDSWNFGDRSGFRVGFTRLGLALAFMAVAAGGLWLAYSKGKSAVSGGGVPLIKADQTAMKSKPDNPGGVSEDGDTPVYSVNAGSGAKVEQLLPGPEQPMTKPQPAPEVVPPPVVAATAVPAPTSTAGAAPSATAAALSTAASIAPSAAPTTAIASAPVAAPAQSTLAPIAAPPTESTPAAAAPPPPPPKPAAPVVKAPKQVAAAGGGPLRIQIAATKDIGSAHKEWVRLKAAHMDVLGDLKAFGVRVDLGDRGIFYRIQAGPIDTRADAVKRCAVLKQSGIGCIIVKQP